MKIGLIACSKTKLGKDTPEKKFKAQDIYQGNTFKKSKSEGIKLYDCDDWFILSGKEDYNLLDKNEEIQYYDVDLGKENKAYKNAWAKNVESKLIKKGFNLENDIFYIFGGSSYYEPLLPFLKNCIAFKFKSSNTIQLDCPVYSSGGFNTPPLWGETRGIKPDCNTI
jgi:hypothetical protein